MNIILNTDKTEAVVIGGTGPQGPPGPISSFANTPDVDLTSLKDGSLLVYKALTNKWLASNSLNAQDVDSGEF